VEKNLGDHKAIDDEEVETVVTRWLITQNTGFSLQKWKKSLSHEKVNASILSV
jgi:hypothetical protein